MATEPKICAHPACKCTVAGSDKYCSQYCADAKGDVEISCDCHHAGCALA